MDIRPQSNMPVAAPVLIYLYSPSGVGLTDGFFKVEIVAAPPSNAVASSGPSHFQIGIADISDTGVEAFRPWTEDRIAAVPLTAVKDWRVAGVELKGVNDRGLICIPEPNRTAPELADLK